MISYAEDIDSKCEVYRSEPKWLYSGNTRLSETRTGYGRKLTSDYKIKFEGKDYRVYVTIYSNMGSSWFKCKKYGQVFIRSH